MKNMASLCCLLVLFSFNSLLYAQIIYTDIPDATPNATCPLDLNNDTIDDFMLQYGGSAGTIGVICSPLNNNAYSGNLVDGLYLPWALSASNSICDSLATWYDANNPGTMAWGTSIGKWVGVIDKYLALKLIVGTNTYYGWARLDVVATSTSFTLKDYAYESTPNTCIQSGQTFLGINENSNKDIFSIFPNPFIYSTTMTIGNLYGQTLKQIHNISGQTISLSRDNLPNGMYFIRLTEENKIIAVNRLIITD